MVGCKKSSNFVGCKLAKHKNDMSRNLIISLILTAFVAGLSSCGEYNKVLKSTDANYKYEYAKRAFEEKRYAQAYTILEDLITVFKGTDKAEESLFLLAMSYYENKDYLTSGTYFKNYYSHYPKGQYAELARYYAGYGYYLDSPDSQLDQSETLKAIEELQGFLDYFPKSDKVSIAQSAIFELQDKLVKKELENAQLYYNLGNYMGNNYESAVITAKNAIKEYPYSKYKEELELLVLKSRYREASESVDEKKEERFRTVIDEYYTFINDYPDSDHRKEADNIFKVANKFVTGN
jgi:outer membrane protein assembly factor BamD